MSDDEDKTKGVYRYYFEQDKQPSNVVNLVPKPRSPEEVVIGELKKAAAQMLEMSKYTDTTDKIGRGRLDFGTVVFMPDISKHFDEIETALNAGEIDDICNLPIGEFSWHQLQRYMGLHMQYMLDQNEAVVYVYSKNRAVAETIVGVVRPLSDRSVVDYTDTDKVQGLEPCPENFDLEINVNMIYPHSEDLE